MASVRYLVDDVDRAIDCYTTPLGITLGHNTVPSPAVRSRATRTATTAAAFRATSSKALVDNKFCLSDPAGNPIELFQPANR
jgi:hypothetical protein